MGSETNYMTDGISLIYLGKVGGYSTETIKGREHVSLNPTGREPRIIPYKNLSKLKIINDDILIDDNCIYNGSYRGINVIPIDSLGMDIKIYHHNP